MKPAKQWSAEIRTRQKSMRVTQIVRLIQADALRHAAHLAREWNGWNDWTISRLLDQEADKLESK